MAYQSINPFNAPTVKTECLALTAAVEVKADIESAPLASINDVLERLAHDEVASRVVLDFGPPRDAQPAARVASIRSSTVAPAGVPVGSR